MVRPPSLVPRLRPGACPDDPRGEVVLDGAHRAGGAQGRKNQERHDTGDQEVDRKVRHERHQAVGFHAHTSPCPEQAVWNRSRALPRTDVERPRGVRLVDGDINTADPRPVHLQVSDWIAAAVGDGYVLRLTQLLRLLPCRDDDSAGVFEIDQGNSPIKRPAVGAVVSFGALAITRWFRRARCVLQMQFSP